MEKYNFEYTDTLGGEPNYCWVKSGHILTKKECWKEAIRKAKREVGLNGVKCRKEMQGDTVALYPVGSCTVLFIF